MNRILTSLFTALFLAALATIASAHELNTKTMVAAAGGQPFFAGSWRCTSGNLNITPEFGPWLTYRSQSNGNISHSFVYSDAVGGGWVNVGVDSSGGYWTMTSAGWQGNTMTYTGTYTNRGSARSQRQVITRNGPNRMSIAIWRNGNLAGQTSCTK